MPQERWEPIPGFPDYLVSDQGRVYNARTESVMAESRTMQGDLKVTLSRQGERTTRSVRVLVAEAFVAPPPVAPSYHKSARPDTVIVLDNNQDNVASYNLAWRPRWFAHKYARQFKLEHPSHYLNRPIENATTETVYSCVIEAALSEGLLFDDVFKSATTGMSVYPNYHNFIFP